MQKQKTLHNVKENLKKNSIFSDIKIPINVIYNLTFNCLLKNIGINKSYANNSNFYEKIIAPKKSNTDYINKLI